MNLILEMFAGNLSLSLIFVTLLLLVVFYVVIKMIMRPVVAQQKGVMSFDLGYILMSIFILIVIILFCIYVLRLQ
ncbi:hypothetical protein [Bacillus sp. KbaB1]|uniref:hypothetical protein n=1 Tax=Bacillus sp. KbaB1 TaxID=1972845 RepID=UPI000B7D7DD5|nr:hypothetical protein [Bacillus sp. KbaB1]OXL97089.1 hypothetical protein B6N65_17535 [Bacillus sp. KbaB1]